MNGLEGRVVLITGGASGLGREIALQTAKLGAKVAIMDMHAERLAQTQKDVSAAAGDCQAHTADITSEADVVRVVGDTVDKWGQLDTVVNSAGVFYGGPITTTPMEQFDRVYGVNVRGLYMMCREAAKVMLPRKSGHIINVASIAAKHAILNESLYSSSKWAVLGISENLNLELGPQGIRVTCICPDGMDTTFWEKDPRKLSGQWNTSRMLQGAHVAQAIVQIASLPEQVVVREALVYRPGSL